MRPLYHCDGIAYRNHYMNQVGRGSFPVYSPPLRGGGIGAILKTIKGFVRPLAQTVGKRALSHLANTGLAVANDVMSGANLTSSLKSRAKQGTSR